MAKNATKEQRKPGIGRGKHPNSRKNLEKGTWQAGESGNPAGKEPGTLDRATVIRKFMDHPMTVQDPSQPKGTTMKVTMYEAGLLGQFRAAMNGSTQAWKEIQDSLHGKLPDKQEHTGEDGAPIEHSIVFKRATNDGDGN